MTTAEDFAALKRRQPDPVAVQLRAAREARGWSIEKVGQLLEVSTITVGSWERGDRQPAVGKLRRWAEMLGHELQVVGSDRVAEGRATWLEHAVRPPVGAMILCDSAEEAQMYAASWPGSQTMQRQVYADPWVATGGLVAEGVVIMRPGDDR